MRGNPRFILRNRIGRQVTGQAERGDEDASHRPLALLRNPHETQPYETQPGDAAYVVRRPEEARHQPGRSIVVFIVRRA